MLVEVRQEEDWQEEGGFAGGCGLGALLISYCHQSIRGKSLMQIPDSMKSRLTPGPGQLGLSPQARASCTICYLLKPHVAPGWGPKDGWPVLPRQTEGQHHYSLMPQDDEEAEKGTVTHQKPHDSDSSAQSPSV